ncbi:MAG: hypothetical protein D6797_02560 [Bdellovibrio sp.]|nr:MAG: hypothetical protein D6797_02560 [Bdellovibrio sp.]
MHGTKKTLKRLLSFVLSLIFFAETLGAVELRDRITERRLSEYFYSPKGNELLVPVKVLGNVRKPGLYHVPANTSLMTLLSLSGGMQKMSDLEKVVVSQRHKGALQMNLNDLIYKGKDLKLTNYDTVFVPEKKSVFSQSTVTAVTVVTSVLSVLLTAVVVSQRNN